jgi:uncharacterized protein with von Willebrand factor type A (vWA) domain
MTARKTKVRTDIYIILDKSGSMYQVWDDTIGGFNTWLEAQKKVVADQTLTLTMFDTVVTKPYTEKPIADVEPLTHLLTYHPDGNTALLDAIGVTVKSIQDAEKKNAILVVIITDGHENSSNEYSKAAIKTLIDDRQKDGWQFLYIGSDQAGFDEASTMGYGTMRTYSSTHSGTQSLYTGLSYATADFAASSIRGQSVDDLTPDLDDKSQAKPVKKAKK